MDEHGIYRLTGCMSSCTKDELEIAEASEIAIKEKTQELEKEPELEQEQVVFMAPRPRPPRPEYGSGNPNGRRKRCLGCVDETYEPKRTLHLYLYYVNSLYDEKEQYVIYDSSSLFADIGGFMGLLLGFSIQSMVEMIEGWSKVLIGRLTNGGNEGRKNGKKRAIRKI